MNPLRLLVPFAPWLVCAACGGSTSALQPAPAPRVEPARDTPPAPSAWQPLSHCDGIDRAAGLGLGPTEARASHVANAVLEGASCWLTAQEFARLDRHRQTLAGDGPVVPAAFVTADHAARVLAPLALEASGRATEAARLRGLAPIVDEATRAAAETTLRSMLPTDLLHGSIPPPGELMFMPSISLDDGHGCTTAHLPAGSVSTPADAAVASAAMAAINLADRGPLTANVRVGSGPANAVTVATGPATMFIGGSQGASTTACFAAQAGADRVRIYEALRDTLDAITAAPVN